MTILLSGCITKKKDTKKFENVQFSINDAPDHPTGLKHNASFFYRNESVLMLTQLSKEKLNWNELTLYLSVIDGDNKFNGQILRINNLEYDREVNHISTYGDNIFIGESNQKIFKDNYVNVEILCNKDIIFSSANSTRVG